MPTWGEILRELSLLVEDIKEGRTELPPGVGPFDAVRRRYLAALHEATGREVILYASDWLGGSDPRLTQVDLGDVQGFMEVVHGLHGPNLDLILHLPGGSAEGAEAIVKYLRKKFDHVRAFVPHAAMSAATMLACSADEIVMGAHSFLGPIDPQMVIRIDGNVHTVPAQAVLDQFSRAQADCSDPSKLGSWLPILKQYGPGLLVQCEHHQKLAEELVKTWLASFMLKEDAEAEKKAKATAARLAAHKDFLSHSRVIDRDKARELGLVVVDLEDNQDLQDLVLSVYHATTHTFQTPAAKVIENHLGKAYVRHGAAVQVKAAPEPEPPPPKKTSGSKSKRKRKRR